MSTPKRSSYPSRQLRGGPAPLASFEDLSDEISSPEEPAVLSPDAETEEDTRTCSEGATPSTPRVLAQTPSTPFGLDAFSAAGTPDSLGPPDDFPGDSRPATAVFSPRSSPLFGRRSKTSTPEPSPELRASNSSLEGAPSPRSTRKLFNVAFFKPRDERSPSPTASPKSPRRTSPAASPKSPRRASPFAGLFKGSAPPRDESESPTKKRSHFPYFLRPKDERHAPTPEPASPAETGKKSRVFGGLFARGHLKTTKPQTLGDEEWAAQPPPDGREPPDLVSTPPDLASTPPPPEANPEDAGSLALPLEAPQVAASFESTQDIVDVAPYDPSLRLGLSPSADTDAVAVGPESPESEAEVPEADPAALKAAGEPEAETLLREDSFDAEEFPAPDLAALPPEKEASRHRDKLAAFRVNPVDRPRSTAPVSFASLEAYISRAAPVAEPAKLRVVLPGEEFEHRERMPKKPVYKSWFEFCEVGLQSPRSRRRQLAARSPSSFPERREVEPPEERRAESVDLGAMGTQEAWASFERRSGSSDDEAGEEENTRVHEPLRSLPDCVFSGGEPEAPPCWANGVMDLLATLPAPKELQGVRTGYEAVKQGNGHVRVFDAEFSVAQAGLSS